MATVPQRPAPQQAAVPAAPIDPIAELALHRKLDLDAVLAALKHDGLINEADALKIRADGRSGARQDRSCIRWCWSPTRSCSIRKTANR